MNNRLLAMIKSQTPTLRLPAVMAGLPAWAQRIVGHLSQAERIILAWLIVIFIVSGSWSIIAYISRNSILTPQVGGIYREAAVGQPRYINPILAGANDLDVDISRLVYSSLFKLDSNMAVQNDLATGYTLSPDQKTYTVQLRSDILWHDGQPFTAEDVLFTIRSIQTPDYGSPLRVNFEGVTVEKVDDYTVTFTLKDIYAPFLMNLTVGIVPQHVWKDVAPKNASLAEQMLKPVGSGPYSFAEIKTRRKTGEITEFSLVRYEQYHGPRQYLDGISFNFYNSHDEANNALLSNAVDGLGFLPLSLYAKTRDANEMVHHLRLPQYFGLFFNGQKNPTVADAGVRSALALAINREEIVTKALQGQGEPLHLPIPPGVFAFNDEIDPPEFNIEAAKQNLEDAGWKDVDGDGIREKNNERLHLKITTTDWPEYVLTAEVVQQQWQAIGVETQIEHFSAGTIQQIVIAPRNYEILFFGEILSADPDPYPFWHSTHVNNLNFAQFKNQEVDKILEVARKTIDRGERQRLYKDFQGKILDIKPAIILYRPYYLFATDNDVRGVNANFAALAAGRFNNIEEWHVNTKRVWK